MGNENTNNNNNINNKYNYNKYLEALKMQIDQNKGFRDWVMRKCLITRSKSQDNNEINVCNLLLNYIYGLNWSKIRTENTK